MRKVIVEFGDLNIGDKFTYKGNMYFGESEYVKAQDHVLVCGTYTNAFCLKHCTMVHFDNETEVDIEAPVTFADLRVGEQFIYCGRAYAKISGHSGRDMMHGSDWHFDGDEEVQCV